MDKPSNIVTINKVREKEAQGFLNKRRDQVERLVQYVGEVPSKSVLRKMPKIKQGEIYWVTLDAKPVVVTSIEPNGRVVLEDLDTDLTLSTGLTLYQLNQMACSKEPILKIDTETEQGLVATIDNFLFKDTCNDYYLLYGKEIHYFSLFNRPTGKTILDTILEAGSLISIDRERVGDVSVLEIWIRREPATATLLYLIPFDKGVIQS